MFENEQEWKNLYKEFFNTEKIKSNYFEDSTLQLAVWSIYGEEFYPYFPIYNESKFKSNTDAEITEYEQHITRNYDSFYFAKLIIEKNIQKSIKLLFNSKEQHESNSSININLDSGYSIPDINKLIIPQLREIKELKLSEKTDQELRIYFIDLKQKILNNFNFKTILIQPIIHHNEIIAVLSVFSNNTIIEVEDFKHNTEQILNYSKQAKYRLLTKVRDEIRPIVSSVMSRNISHNIGSHVLVNVENRMYTTPIAEHQKLITYILERMNFIAQVSTLWSPVWSLPRHFQGEVIQQFLEQRHILHNILTSDGLFFKEEYQNNYHLTQSNQDNDERHTFKIIPCQKEPCQPNEKNELQDTQHNDIVIDIPGGKVGYHALYTIIENILRNAAKYGYATLSSSYKKQMILTIKLQKSDDEHQFKVKIWDNVSYISNTKYEYELNSNSSITCNNIERVENEPFIKLSFSVDDAPLYIFVHLQKEFDHQKKLKNIGLHSASKNFGYAKKLKEKNVFFMSEARFHSFLRDLENEEIDEKYHYKNIDILQRAHSILKKKNTSKKLLLYLKKRVLTPIHIRINNFLRAPIINSQDQKKLNENNGLAEIYICANYLSGSDYADLANPEYEKQEKDRPYIKAMPIADYDKNGNLICHRLGYEFVLNKPTVYTLNLSDKFIKKLSFTKVSTDNSFVLRTAKNREDISLRQSPEIVSSEFLICDISKYEQMINEPDYKDTFNRFPYRIILLTDDKNKSIQKNDELFIKKRVALLQISEWDNADEFKKIIFQTWSEHLLRINKHNQIDTKIIFNGSNFISNSNELIDISKNLLTNFTSHLNQIGALAFSEERVKEIIKVETMSIIKDTTLFNLFQSENEQDIYEEHTSSINEEVFTHSLPELKKDFSSKTILMTRHEPSKRLAIKGANIQNDVVYFESLSGGTNQFWLYSNMLQKESNTLNLAFNRLKILETALYRIAIFDERLIKMMNADKAAEQNIYIINKINNHGISNTLKGLEGKLQEDQEFTLRHSSGQEKKIDIDILIIHYGLLEKIQAKSKLSQKQLDKLFFSFPLVVLTSGRGILQDNKRAKDKLNNSLEHLKFVSFPVLKEYFRHETINKISLTQMLMNLIGIQNQLSGLYDE
jgi:hypothetical protein